MKVSPTVTLDSYVLDSLMVDLVRHDRRPAAYILYLALVRLGGAGKRLFEDSRTTVGGASRAARTGGNPAGGANRGAALQGAPTLAAMRADRSTGYP